MSDWTPERRREALADGRAMPPAPGETEPRYPIEDAADVRHAVEDYERAGHDDPDVRAHIVRNAVRIGATDELPDYWRVEPR